mmetsp:Transcript_129265/g.335170  ORF Transcript_129265/g.335170 Transcript_129265/m.335170 type:complete len:210 (-) Transcript_129265:1524-2153(-)
MARTLHHQVTLGPDVALDDCVVQHTRRAPEHEDAVTHPLIPEFSRTPHAPTLDRGIEGGRRHLCALAFGPAHHEVHPRLRCWRVAHASQVIEPVANNDCSHRVPLEDGAATDGVGARNHAAAGLHADLSEAILDQYHFARVTAQSHFHVPVANNGIREHLHPTARRDRKSWIRGTLICLEDAILHYDCADHKVYRSGRTNPRYGNGTDI